MKELNILLYLTSNKLLMKRIIPLLAIAIVLFSCDKEVKRKASPVKDVPLKERPIPAIPGVNTSNSVIGGAHYICPKNCVGGVGAAAGKCPVCETEMAHNQGFHIGKDNNKNAMNPVTTTPATNTNDGPNSNGQYHYTCTNGCTGGKGSAGNCDSCGNALEHNAAFHS